MSSDKNLGMGRQITRRQFCQGSAVAIGAGLLPWVQASEFAGSAEINPAYYPPAKTGLRGAHPGSFETAHALAHEGKRWNSAEDTGEGEFDLVVVGGGISGLSAAYFFHREKPDSRILVLDNHDDFGGHAKRNEFTVNGKTMIGYGGSQSIDSPSSWSPEAIGLLKELTIDLDVFHDAFDQGFYERLGMKSSFWLDKETFGVDRLVRGNHLYFRHAGLDKKDGERFVTEITTSPEDRAALMAIVHSKEDYLAGKTTAEKVSYLRSLSYEDYLRRHAGATANIINIVNGLPKTFWGIGSDGISAREAMFLSMPGFDGLGIDLEKDDPYYSPFGDDPYIFHFPDGNAGITRLLVRKLVPGVADGSTMQDQVTARFNYSALDQPANHVKIRLNATVVNIEHLGALPLARTVGVRYVKNGLASEVRTKNVVYAGYSAMLPYLCPEFPPEQAAGFANLVKAPLLYANVLIQNWQPFNKLGVSSIRYPGGLFDTAALDFPVSLGGYQYARTPSDPMLVHLVYVPTKPGQGMDMRTQNRRGRHTMLKQGFDDYERAIRRQMGDSLAAGGFDPGRDIQALTVNRWPHGYAYEYNDLFDPPDWNRHKGPHIDARKPFGRISIANSDSEARAYADAAIDAAHRAVVELNGV